MEYAIYTMIQEIAMKAVHYKLDMKGIIFAKNLQMSIYAKLLVIYMKYQRYAIRYVINL